MAPNAIPNSKATEYSCLCFVYVISARIGIQILDEAAAPAPAMKSPTLAISMLKDKLKMVKPKVAAAHDIIMV